VQKVVKGKSVTQARVHGYTGKVRVSHQGYLPALSDGHAQLPVSSIDTFAAYAGFYFKVATMDYDPESKTVLMREEDEPVWVSGGRNAWKALVDAGFKCYKGRCAPVKRSVVTEYPALVGENSGSYLDAAGQKRGDSWYVAELIDSSYAADPSGNRWVANLSVRIGSAPDEGIGMTVAFWDHGTPDALKLASVRSQNSFKRERLGLDEGWCGPGTYLGIPASHRKPRLWVDCS